MKKILFLVKRIKQKEATAVVVEFIPSIFNETLGLNILS